MLLKVVRYTALLTGVLYGVIHKRTLQAAHEQKHEHQSRHRHEQLVAKAKDAWRQRQTPKSGDDGKNRASLLRAFNDFCSWHQSRRPYF
jgi:F-type H+-transporting ATP synthase subunit e